MSRTVIFDRRRITLVELLRKGPIVDKLWRIRSADHYLKIVLACGFDIEAKRELTTLQEQGRLKVLYDGKGEARYTFG